jgi:hypothetical protein
METADLHPEQRRPAATGEDAASRYRFADEEYEEEEDEDISYPQWGFFFILFSSI